MNIFLKPATVAGESVLVRDPETLIPLDADGEWKPSIPFWTRRLRDGDVMKAAPPNVAPPPADVPDEPAHHTSARKKSAHAPD